MEITEINRDKNHCVKVSFSGGNSVLLDSDFAAESCIRVGEEITEEKLKQLVSESDYVRAKSRALWFMDRADHSEKALFEKIIKGGISSVAAARAIARLREIGVLDDRRYALRLAERMNESNISKREAYMKLNLKGVPREIINEVLMETEFDEAQQIRALIDKKYARRLQSGEDTQKVYAALVRKGFSYSAVREALKSRAEELEYMDV